jgi:hypothetical protein
VAGRWSSAAGLRPEGEHQATSGMAVSIQRSAVSQKRGGKVLNIQAVVGLWLPVFGQRGASRRRRSLYCRFILQNVSCGKIVKVLNSCRRHPSPVPRPRQPGTSAGKEHSRDFNIINLRNRGTDWLAVASGLLLGACGSGLLLRLSKSRSLRLPLGEWPRPLACNFRRVAANYQPAASIHTTVHIVIINDT